MRVPLRFLSGLFGLTLVIAMAGVAGAEPPAVDTTTTPSPPTTQVSREDPVDPSAPPPGSGYPSAPQSTVDASPAPPPDAGIEMGTVAIRAATLSDDQPVPGVSVAVARCGTGAVVGTPATGPDGTTSVSASLGCYVVSLAGFPDGYDAVSSGPWQVDLTEPGQMQKVGFTFARWTPQGEGTIAVHARHVDAGTPVPGVTASVRSCVDDVPYGYLTTDVNGDATSTFPLNCYVVNVVTIPADTALVSGGPFTVELGEPGVVRTVDVTLDFSLPPEPPVPTAHGRIIKMDRISGVPLEGAVFVVGPCNSEWSHREVTGPDGRIALSLAPGCYVAKEVVAPDGYIADTRPITFTATDDEFFTVQALNMPEAPGPIFRNPDIRIPVQSIPAGRTEGR
ncbi:MAG: prealbumin-like fold domain-containing protein [Rhodococcus sp. (in: high G+C Gram-positive bacteria)]|uniref:MSCRAMM family protein n=1 Tax=Rhodococcus sp. TaxID=1831 RepID=UPI003BB6A282